MSVVSRDGFQVLPGLLTQDDVGELRLAIEETIDRAARAMLTPYEASCPGAPIEERLERVASKDRAYASALFHVAMADAQHDGRLSALAAHPGLAAAIRDAVTPQHPTGHVIRTRAAIRAFTSKISPWHQDVPRPDDRSGCAAVRVACWIPLSDVDEHTGALEVLPGAWKVPCSHEVTDDGHLAIPESSLPAGDARVISMRRGDVLLLDRFVPHRARPTTGAWGRWSVVMWVKTAPAGAAC